MAEPSFQQHVASLNATLSMIEESLARGSGAVEGLEAAELTRSIEQAQRYVF